MQAYYACEHPEAVGFDVPLEELYETPEQDDTLYPAAQGEATE